MRNSPSSRRIFSPVLAAVGGAEDLAEDGAEEDQVRIGGIGRDPPDGRIRRLRQVDDLPGLAPVAAAEQHPSFARRLVADREEHDARIVGAFGDAAEIGPGRIRHLDPLPAAALVAAAVEAFLGRAQDRAAPGTGGAAIVVKEDEIVGIRALQPVVAFLPGLAAVAADEDAVDLDGDPDRAGIARVEMDRRHPRRVDELAFHAVGHVAASARSARRRPSARPAPGACRRISPLDREATGRSGECAGRPSARADAPSGRRPRSSDRRPGRCPPAPRPALPDGSRRTRRGIRCRCRRSA